MKTDEFKRRMPRCARFDYKGIEGELKKMAEEGWQLEQCDNNGSWMYRKAEPANKDFCVVFCKDARYFRYGETRSQQELEEQLKEQGWEKAGQWNKMLIFSADGGTALPREADEYTRLQNTKYALKGTFAAESFLAFAALMMLALVIIPDAYKDMQELGAWYYGADDIFKTIFVSIIVIYLAIEIAGFFMWYKKSEENIVSAARISKMYFYLQKGLYIFIAATALLSIIAICII